MRSRVVHLRHRGGHDHALPAQRPSAFTTSGRVRVGLRLLRIAEDGMGGRRRARLQMRPS